MTEIRSIDCLDRSQLIIGSSSSYTVCTEPGKLAAASAYLLCVHRFQAWHQMWVLLCQTGLIAATDAGDKGFDKETWASIVMTLPMLFGFHSRPGCASAGPGRYQALTGKQDRTV